MKTAMVLVMIVAGGFSGMMRIVLEMEGPELGVSVMKQYGYYYAAGSGDTVRALEKFSQYADAPPKLLPQIPMTFDDLELPLTVKLNQNCFESLPNISVPKYAHISFLAPQFRNQSLIPEMRIVLYLKGQGEQNEINPRELRRKNESQPWFECRHGLAHIAELNQEMIKQTIRKCINANPQVAQEWLRKSSKLTNLGQPKTSSLWSSLIKFLSVVVGFSLLLYHHYHQTDNLLI